MSSIGGQSCNIMRGLPQKLRPRVDTWEVPGLDGVGAQLLGSGDGEFQLQTVTYVPNSGPGYPNADANTLIDACTNLQGSLATIVDDWGTTYNNVLVLHVDSTGAKRPVIYKGQPAIRVELNWKLVTAS